MKHNRVSKISYLVVIGILLCVVANSILAAAMETDVTQGGYNENASVDLPGDGPPENITRPITRIRLPSENIKRFRTDTAPELDWYQPCDGGDNLINFYINVHDVDVSTIKSAKLTLAVWDVDYDCGSACNGICERDTVYINGHRLMTPEPYLTGANNQWSTCTFNVDPEWIIEGDNYVEIFIDLWSGECWCVECDWGELRLELVDVKVVEIDAEPLEADLSYLH